jgi:NAD(P)-dependent dehydrogenase (short-subunit alcohol dehydrogenase family)
MFDLTGRVALVTGAGQGVGAGVARCLAAQGATVAVNDLYGDRAAAVVAGIEEGGGRAVAVAADVTDRDAVIRAVDGLASAVGPVDILVSNAGVPAGGFPLRAFRDMQPSEWDRFVALNLYGLLHCCHAVVDGMCERQWGRIVMVSSEAGRQGLASGISIYGAAKAGAVGFIRHLAAEVGPLGVTANAVSLGRIGDATTDPRLARRFPVPRLGLPGDIGAAVVYLASDEASWVTGQTVPVNGGVYSS